MTNLASHPSTLLETFLHQRTDIREVELSAYKYVPHTVQDERIVYRIPATEIALGFNKLRAQLPPDADIAFHSRVYVRVGHSIEIRHLPLIDLQGSFLDPIRTGVQQISRELGWEHTATYFSGRSHHVYGLSLLTVEQWIWFMGRCLLLNAPEKSDVVDARWIGHRIMAGYGALRWTTNHPRYLAEPQLVDLW
jgi:hypothetical protein